MATEKTKLLPGGITEEQMKEWEGKYGARNDFIKRGAVESLVEMGRKLYVYFRKPDKNVIALAMSRGEEGGKKTPMKSSDVLRANCLLFAEPELLNDEVNKGQYEVAIGKLIGDAFPMPEAEIEKI